MTLSRDELLPLPVRRYVERAVSAAPTLPRLVRITQVGEMRQQPGGRWLRFSAVQELAVEEVAFDWRARFPIVPLVSLRVVDRYAAGEGLLQARLWGLIPVMSGRGQHTNEGEAIRYLSELAWVPHAMLANRGLEWRELDERTVEVATRVGPARVAVRLEFDAAGDIVSASTGERPRLAGKKIVPTPWGGVFSEYAVLGGIRVPTRAEVSWELADGPFTYWHGRVTSLETGQHSLVGQPLSARDLTVRG